jgi:hypothetical protein
MNRNPSVPKQDEFWFDRLFAGLATSPIGRGRRVAPVEGLRSLVRAAPLTRFATQIDLSPLGRGGSNTRKIDSNSSAFGAKRGYGIGACRLPGLALLGPRPLPQTSALRHKRTFHEVRF